MIMTEVHPGGNKHPHGRHRPRHRRCRMEYLLPVQSTWEPEEKLLAEHPHFVTNYTSQWIITNNVIKIEDDEEVADIKPVISELLPIFSVGSKELSVAATSINEASCVVGEQLPFLTDLKCCSYCLKSFPSPHELAEHILTHSSGKPFACSHCDKTFASEERLEVHTTSTHTHVKPVQCEHCDRSFSQLGDLQRHAYTHTAKETFECEYCSRRFRTESYLKKHLRSHRKTNSLACSWCKKKFEEESHLLEHVSENHDKPYQCDSCNAMFWQRSGFLTHRHNCCSQMKRLQCKLCDKAFDTKIQLENHTNVSHTQKRFYVMEKDLISQSRLVPHLGFQTRYECDSCDKKFSKKSQLVQHLLKHRQKEVFKCGKCDKSFRTNNTLIAHKRTHMIKSAKKT